MKKPTFPKAPTAADVDAAVERYKTKTRVFRESLPIGNKHLWDISRAWREFAERQGVSVDEVTSESGGWGSPPVLRCKREETDAEKRERVKKILDDRYRTKKYEYERLLSQWSAEQRRLAFAAQTNLRVGCCPSNCCCRRR